jgi:glutamyl-tRNA reductase
MAYKAGKRIDGSALESIMHDVLQGMQDFTSETCISGNAASMEILAVERAEQPAANSAKVIRFPGQANK